MNGPGRAKRGKMPDRMLQFVSLPQQPPDQRGVLEGTAARLAAELQPVYRLFGKVPRPAARAEGTAAA